MILTIKTLLDTCCAGDIIEAAGWIRSIRCSGGVAFGQLSDGSTIKTLQVTADENNACFETIKDLSLGAAVRVRGTLSESKGRDGGLELLPNSLEILGECDSDYPLQKKAMSLDYLRGLQHLRIRTNTFGAVARVRDAAARAIHNFFHSKGFFYVHTPIITASDCEGAGEMFTLKDSADFFGKTAALTVSGQLEAETLAAGLGRVYTFGPTFRAERSNTTRHLAEFWMVEPEAMFFNLTDIMDLAEDFLHSVIGDVLDSCGDDLAFFNTRIKPSLLDDLSATKKPFSRITYTEAVKILEAANDKFKIKATWGGDIATEHERYLCEEVYKGAVMVYNYPRGIKSFYMKVNGDGETVAAVDVLLPGIGEIIGGSERESDYQKLLNECKRRNMDLAGYDWYLDLRRYGGAPHSGFGLGFDRLVRFLTGLDNIKDVIPYPRAYHLAAG